MRCFLIFGGVLGVVGLAGLGCEPPAHVYPLLHTTGNGGAVGVGGGGNGAFGTGAYGGGAACGFAAPSDFAVPAVYAGASGSPPFAGVAGSLACTSGANTPTFALADLNGDAKLDLVITQRCNDATVGTTAWWMYPNMGSGFAANAIVFALPAGFSGTSAPFTATSGSLACTGGANLPTFVLADMDADGKPDLVVTQACNDASVGATRWSVYKNSGAGFAASAIAWPLPPGYAGSSPAFATIGGALSCAAGASVPAFTLVDMDGDGKLDLLVTQRCNDALVGQSSWVFYKNTGTGFAPTATVMALPGGYSAPSPVFAATFGSVACSGANAPQFSLVDMDGDARPDLLVTQTCNDTLVGTARWLVYKNAAAGFAATASTWALPSGYFGPPNGSMTHPFPDVAGTIACQNGANVPAFTLVDVNADGKPDILATQRCNDTSTGTTTWFLYKNTGAGFTPSATLMPLPAGYVGAPNSGAVPFADVTGTLVCANGANIPSFTLVDLSGDLRPDIVITQRCNDAATGANRWLLAASTCK